LINLRIDRILGVREGSKDCGSERRKWCRFISIFGETTWPVGLITIFELRRRQQQRRGTALNSLLSRKTAGRSAVAPHGVFKCKMKLRRGTLTPRYEVDERDRRKGITQMGICANMYNDTPR
jgi:hypothetical protein